MELAYHCAPTNLNFVAPKSGVLFQGGGVFSASAFCKLGQRKALSFPNNKYVPACVSSLLGRGGPLAISRLIIAISVNAIKGMCFRWSRPDVGPKSLEAVFPRSAHGNASASVSLIPSIVGICAAIFHRLPRAIFRRLFAMAMDKSGLRSSYFLNAPTTGRVPALKIGGHDSGIAPTGAFTMPSRLTALRVIGAPLNRKKSERSPRQVNHLHKALLA